MLQGQDPRIAERRFESMAKRGYEAGNTISIIAGIRMIALMAANFKEDKLLIHSCIDAGNFLFTIIPLLMATFSLALGSQSMYKAIRPKNGRATSMENIGEVDEMEAARHQHYSSPYQSGRNALIFSSLAFAVFATTLYKLEANNFDAFKMTVFTLAIIASVYAMVTATTPAVVNTLRSRHPGGAAQQPLLAAAPPIQPPGPPSPMKKY